MKKVKCPKCWKENSPKVDFCKYCGLLLKDKNEFDIDDEDIVVRKKFHWTKIHTIITVSVILGVIIVFFVSGSIFAAIMNHYNGNYSVNITYNKSTEILTFNMTVEDGEVLINKITIYDQNENLTLSQTKLNVVLPPDEPYLITIHLEYDPDLDFIYIQITYNRGRMRGINFEIL